MQAVCSYSRIVHTQLDIRLATLSIEDDGLLLVRFKPGVKFDLEGLVELQVARKDLARGRTWAMLTIIPENVDFDMEVMNTDHYRPFEAHEHTRALAVVAKGSMNELLAKLYYTYFPTAFEAKVFSTEEAARAWLHERMAEADSPLSGNGAGR